MKKIIATFTVFIGLLNASSGKAVYQKYCASCHNITMEWANMTTMKAPPFLEVAHRVKAHYPRKKEFIRFVVDYIQNPSRDKGLCMPMAFKRFGVMPPIGKSMNAKERKAVAEYLYSLSKKRGFCPAHGG
ncbi:cytochrome c class I [Nitratiruptor sp. YY08-26]|uniref:c-type cytochrome n=1 Tax=unclassified Nitratiruptor TaxID=2624044 RepID=UPI0019150F18|nr:MULTISPECIES: cytochrome c [unclassified Nitratiruptor]BCD62290.1 cytochrome c class I [Nitratiruptor sp. YY08-13]BCD66226.1 cytochrome c class I [Nitratiruptor sp. YY08-26]